MIRRFWVWIYPVGSLSSLSPRRGKRGYRYTAFVALLCYNYIPFHETNCCVCGIREVRHFWSMSYRCPSRYLPFSKISTLFVFVEQIKSTDVADDFVVALMSGKDDLGPVKGQEI